VTSPAILVVDDEKNIRLTMGQALSPLGLTVETAMNGEEALQKLGQRAFAVVFLDLRMPGMDGLEVLRRIREERPATRVIIITAHGTVDTAVEAMKLGAVDFLEKPFTPDQVRELARAVLAREVLPENSRAAGHGAGAARKQMATGEVRDPREEPDGQYRTLVELAKRLLAGKDFAAARDAARKAVGVDPSRPEALNLLGVILEAEGDWVEGQRFYRASLNIDPTYGPARKNLERTTTWGRVGRADPGPALTD
jgi:CheY-like chemotaxis protein